MPRRHLHVLIALLLPLMVVRGLLPAGFMPVAQGGELRMALCSDGLQLPGSGDSRDHAPGVGGDCLFAHAAASAPPPTVITFSPLVPVEGTAAGTLAAQQKPGLILRAQSSRGPPALQ